MTFYIIMAFQKMHTLKLLQHPLVEEFFFQKFWLMTFPFFLLNLLFYIALLVTLNWFVLVVPRPGPDSETCEPLEFADTEFMLLSCVFETCMHVCSFFALMVIYRSGQERKMTILMP